jgi:hypothetical protein
MYSLHHGPAPDHAYSDLPTSSNSTNQIHGFTWSYDPDKPIAQMSASEDDITSPCRDGSQPRQPRYSKLYERFIKKREVFVHSNIDARRSALFDQVSLNGYLFASNSTQISKAPDNCDSERQSTTLYHHSNASSAHPPLTTSYATTTENDSNPYVDDDFLHGYSGLSNYWPAESHRASSPNYHPINPGVRHPTIAVPDPSFTPGRPLSPPPTHHQPLPARFHSSYSELSANVAFLSDIKSQSQLTSSNKSSGSKSPSGPSTIALAPHGEVRASTPSDQTSSNRSATQPRPIARRKNLPDGERRGSTASPRISGSKALTGKKGNDVRRQPSLACFFCRERKIACGRPAEGSVDRTCKYVTCSMLLLQNS